MSDRDFPVLSYGQSVFDCSFPPVQNFGSKPNSTAIAQRLSSLSDDCYINIWCLCIKYLERVTMGIDRGKQSRETFVVVRNWIW